MLGSLPGPGSLGLKTPVLPQSAPAAAVGWTASGRDELAEAHRGRWEDGCGDPEPHPPPLFPGRDEQAKPEPPGAVEKTSWKPE